MKSFQPSSSSQARRCSSFAFWGISQWKFIVFEGLSQSCAISARRTDGVRGAISLGEKQFHASRPREKGQEQESLGCPRSQNLTLRTPSTRLKFVGHSTESE